jgi:hypothetical protein
VAVVDDRDVVAGIWPGEGVWLGFQAVDPSAPTAVRVRVEGEPEHQLVCPPDHALPGRRSGRGHLPFSEGRLTVLTDGEDRAQVVIRLVSADEFTGMTGMSMEPIDPESGFGGHLLP